MVFKTSLSLLLLMVLSSCKKEYSCICEAKSNGTVYSSSTFVSKQKKNDAAGWCDSNAASATTGTLTVKTECRLE